MLNESVGNDYCRVGQFFCLTFLFRGFYLVFFEQFANFLLYLEFVRLHLDTVAFVFTGDGFQLTRQPGIYAIVDISGKDVAPFMQLAIGRDLLDMAEKVIRFTRRIITVCSFCPVGVLDARIFRLVFVYSRIDMAIVRSVGFGGKGDGTLFRLSPQVFHGFEDIIHPRLTVVYKVGTGF